MTDYFDRLEEELRSAHAHAEGASPVRKRRRVRTRFAVAAVAGLIVAVPASAAVTGIWPQREPDGLVRTAGRTVVASGEDERWGRWEAFISDSAEGDCFGLRLLDPPGGESEGCGPANEPARIAGGSGPPRAAVFGLAPAGATEVRVEAGRQDTKISRTYPNSTGRGPFYFVSFPTDRLERLKIVALRDGQPVQGGQLAP